jgi:hypothetical protein
MKRAKRYIDRETDKTNRKEGGRGRGRDGERKDRGT